MEDKPLVLMTHDLPPDWVENTLNDFRVIFGDNDQRGIENKLEEYSVCWMIQFRQPLSIKLPFLKLSAIWLLAQTILMLIHAPAAESRLGIHLAFWPMEQQI
jgi:hypothetical protein